MDYVNTYSVKLYNYFFCPRVAALQVRENDLFFCTTYIKTCSNPTALMFIYPSTKKVCKWR